MPKLRILWNLNKISDEFSELITLLQELLLILCWPVQLYLIVFVTKIFVDLKNSCINIFVLLLTGLHMKLEILLQLLFKLVEVVN